MIQPRIRHLQLGSVRVQCLSEDAECIAETVAPCRNLCCGKRVEIAGCETTETAISKPSVSLLLENVLKVESKGLDRAVVLLLGAEVEYSIVCKTIEMYKTLRRVRGVSLRGCEGAKSCLRALPNPTETSTHKPLNAKVVHSLDGRSLLRE